MWYTFYEWGTGVIEQQVTEMIHWIYSSYNKVGAKWRQGFDRDVRHPEWTRWLLDTLESPDKAGTNVVVTGSKGKGSHAILLAAILQRMGLRVGLFTSPHLVNFLERIRVDGEAISDADFVKYARMVRVVSDAAPVPNNQYIGPVGLVAVMAALYFRDRQTDVNIFELGRGALHDDVNQIRHVGAVCTPVIGEHLDKLGPTLANVVQEKMGAVTSDTQWLVSHRQTPEVLAQMQTALCHHHGLALAVLNEDFSYQLGSCADGRTVVQTSGSEAHKAIISSYITPFASNVAVALEAAVKVMTTMGKPTCLAVDVSDLRLPGRLQIIRKQPLCVLDGTVHELGARLIVAWLKEQSQAKAVHVVLSLPDDKDAHGVIQTLLPHCSTVCFTTSSNQHLRYTRNLVPIAEPCIGVIDTEPHVSQAVQQALARADNDDIVLFVGTQSFVGDVLTHFGAPTESIWDCQLKQETRE